MTSQIKEKSVIEKFLDEYGDELCKECPLYRVWKQATKKGNKK